MSYTMYSQLDDRWQRVKLGESSTTIGKNGCLVCSVASGLTDMGVEIYGLPPDPPQLNRWLARNKGFTAPAGSSQRNLFVFDSLRALGVKMVDYFDARSRPAPAERLEPVLAREHQFAVIQVDFAPGGSAAEQHWVRAISWHDEDILIMDPWITGPSQEATLMTRYALPSWDTMARAIYRLAVYEYKKPNPDAEFSISMKPRWPIYQEQLSPYQPYTP